MNKQQLAAKIWESANQMRSKIEANDYKDYILGFIFYKYLSEKEVQFVKSEDMTETEIKTLSEEDLETANHVKKNLGYFIAYDNLFSTWIAKGKDFDVSNVRDALSAFSRSISPKHKKLFDKIFETLETGLSKLGESAATQTKAVSDLIHLINGIPMDGKQDYDVLGFIYEYLISQFAANAGKKAGEFYTPHEVSVLMSEIVANYLKDRTEIKIYDPTSGSGSLLINIGNSVAKHVDGKDNIKYYAQELKQNTYNLTRMNLIMRGIISDNIETRNGDTLEVDWPYFDESEPILSYNPLYVDAVVSNPPYSQSWDPANKEADPRYSRFGLAPKGKADYAFLLHDLYHIKPDGIMAIVLPHGVLFRGGEEGAIRKNLIEQNHIDTIIGLPASIFFGTGIPTIIVVLKQRRENTDILIIDASKGFVKEGKNNKLQASDIKRIADAIRDRKSTPKFADVVTRDAIRKNDYNLNIPRYVDSSANPESWDIYATMFGGIPVNEIDELQAFWEAFPNLRETLFSNTSEVNAALKVEDVRQAIQQHDNVQAFVKQFDTSFANLNAYLKMELLANMLTVSVPREEEILGNDLFARLSSIPLIDRYEAYQLLDNEWETIKVDLEIIQTEGFAATKQVDSNMVTKKKKGKDVEVQEGWKGHIMPFALVQRTYLKKELDALKQKEDHLFEIDLELEQLLDSFSEEEKEAKTVNDAKDAFVPTEVAKQAKKYLADIKKGERFDKDAYETKVIAASKLLAKEKTLRAEVKADKMKLNLLTKKTVEALTDKQVDELLELKWIHPLVTSLNALPDTMVKQLTAKVQALANKYATTYTQVVQEIQKTENTIAEMLDDLQGNEFDTKGLNELKKLLKTVDYGV